MDSSAAALVPTLTPDHDPGSAGARDCGIRFGKQACVGSGAATKIGTPQHIATAQMSTVVDRDQELSTEEFAEALSMEVGETVTADAVRSWRGSRPKPIPFIKRHDGGVRYAMSTVKEVAKAWRQPKLPAALQDARRLLPGPILGRQLTTADADRVYALLCEGRGAPVIGTATPHAARVDSAIFRATEALNGLVREAAHHAVVAIAMDRAAAAAGGTSGVTPEGLAQALDAYTIDLGRQHAQVLADELVARARIVALRERHRQLRDAVTARIAALEQERRDALHLLDELQARPRDEINRDVVANVPADRRAAVLAALGDGGAGHHAEVADLQTRQQSLAQQIERLKGFAIASPGDYSALAGWPDLAALADALKG